MQVEFAAKNRGSADDLQVVSWDAHEKEASESQRPELENNENIDKVYESRSR